MCLVVVVVVGFRFTIVMCFSRFFCGLPTHYQHKKELQLCRREPKPLPFGVIVEEGKKGGLLDLSSKIQSNKF